MHCGKTKEIVPNIPIPYEGQCLYVFDINDVWWGMFQFLPPKISTERWLRNTNLPICE